MARTTRDGEQFVVEAAWTAQRLGDTVSNTLPPHLTDAIDSVPSPNFFVSYNLDKAGSAAPPRKRLKAGLTRWLASLDPDQVIAGSQRKVPLPRHTWQEAGWRLTFEAIQRAGPSASTPDRMLDAVKRKGGKYGDLNLPFIVAVGHAAAFPEDEDTETALYGTSVEYTHARTPTLGRKADGYWTATYAHAHGRVGGVLIVDNPAPWTWTKNTPVLWRSPDPRSLPAPILPTWATAQLVDVQVEHQPAARPTHTALGLPKHWPVGDAFPRRQLSNPS